jgi:hypothetical protein
MVKARMEETGESWQAAAREVRQQGEKQVRKELVDYILRFTAGTAEHKKEILQKLAKKTTRELRALSMEVAAANIAVGMEEKDWTEEEQEDGEL